MLNETFNDIPVEQETADDDTIVYTAGSNGKPLLASIEKEFDLNQIIRKFYRQDKIYVGAHMLICIYAQSQSKYFPILF